MVMLESDGAAQFLTQVNCVAYRGKEKKGPEVLPDPLNILVASEGLEPPTNGL